MLKKGTVGKYKNESPLEIDMKRRGMYCKRIVSKIFCIKRKLIHFAEKTFRKRKGWIEFVSCRNGFPGNLSIDFMNNKAVKFNGIMYYRMKNSQLNNRGCLYRLQLFLII